MPFVYYRAKYCADNSTAIQMVSETEGPWATISVCLVEYGLTPPDENHIYVPAYKLDEFTLEQIKKDIIDEIIIDNVPIGYGTGWLVRLKPNWKEITEEM